MAPTYLSDCLPTTIGETVTYNLRNNEDYRTQRCLSYRQYCKMKPPEFGQAECFFLIWKKWVEILHYQVRNSTTL
jgi:hypothetical protein